MTIVCLRLGLGCSAKWGGGGSDLCQDFLDKFSGRHPACAEEVGRGGGGEDG